MLSLEFLKCFPYLIQVIPQYSRICGLIAEALHPTELFLVCLLKLFASELRFFYSFCFLRVALLVFAPFHSLIDLDIARLYFLELSFAQFNVCYVLIAVLRFVFHFKVIRSYLVSLEL